MDANHCDRRQWREWKSDQRERIMNNSATLIAAKHRTRDGCYSEKALGVLGELKRRVDQIYDSVQKTQIWQTVISPNTPDDLLRACIREILLSVCWYQKHTTEAGFHMLGRLPKDETILMKSLMLHKIEEAEHGVWAHKDYLELGGSLEEAHGHSSPAGFAIESVWWRMATTENPFGYLGAEYLFEYLTAMVSQPAVEVFQRRNIQWKGARFVIQHAIEDIKHTNLIHHLIGDTITRHPESADAMILCLDYFRAVYPLPVWNEAFERATSK